MTVLTGKSSTIFVSTEQGIKVYKSVHDIPRPLRRKLQESMRGMHTATILIADKRGQQELVRALQGQPSHVQCRLAQVEQAQRKTRAAAQQRARFSALAGFRSLRNWLELLLPVAVGASLWFFVESRF